MNALIEEFAGWLAHPSHASLADKGDALELLMFGDISEEERDWLTDFVARWDNAEEALRLCRKWVEKLGWGFHPDTRGADYRPALSPDEIAAYDYDMERLFGLPLDPYAYGVKALEELK
jgi:hypothetical protein